MRSKVPIIWLLLIPQTVVAQENPTSAPATQLRITEPIGNKAPLMISSDIPVSDHSSVSLGLLQSLGFESAAILSGLDLRDTVANQTHECNLKGYESERSRVITSAESFSGRQSIAYTVKKTSGLGPAGTFGLDWFGNGTDKIHHWIVPRERTEDSLLEFGKSYYFGFAFKIDPQSEVPVPGNGVIIFQLWQGPPFCPPLKVHLINVHDKFHLAVSGRNNITGSNPSARWEIVQKGVLVEKGQWIRCVVKIVIRHHNMAQPGEVEVWMAEGRGKLDKTAMWTGPIGYDPSTKANYDGRTDVPHPRSNLVPTFGIYRERQPRQLTLYFDNVRYATERLLADPLQASEHLAGRSSLNSAG